MTLLLSLFNKYRYSETIPNMFSLHSKTDSSAVITAPNKLSFLLAKALVFALEWKAQDELSICQHGPHSHHHLKQVWFSLNRSVFLHGIMGNLPFKIHPTQLELPRRHLKKKKIIIQIVKACKSSKDFSQAAHCPLLL